MESNKNRRVITVLIIGDEFDEILLINKIYLGREIIYKDFNSGLTVYKEIATLNSNIYKKRFIIYKWAFVNIFNKGLIIIAGKNIMGNRAFNNIYNRKLIIITEKRL